MVKEYSMRILGRTGKQFFFYYLLFFFCFVIFFIILYQINLSMVTRVYRNSSVSFLETGLNNLEQDIAQIETIATTIYNSPRFRWLSFLSQDMEIIEYYNTIQLRDDFRRYFASMGMIIDCCII